MPNIIYIENIIISYLEHRYTLFFFYLTHKVTKYILAHFDDLFCMINISEYFFNKQKSFAVLSVALHAGIKSIVYATIDSVVFRARPIWLIILYYIVLNY